MCFHLNLYQFNYIFDNQIILLNIGHQLYDAMETTSFVQTIWNGRISR